jgi:hypothetical protein
MAFAGVDALSNVWTVLQSALSASRLRSGYGSVPGASPDTEAMLSALRDYTELGLRVGAVQAGVMLAMSVALFVIGLFLYQRREIGRKAALVWSVVAFFVLAGRAVVFELVLWPAFERFMEVSKIGALSGVSRYGGWMGGFARGGTYLTLLFMAAYPIVLLVLLTRPSVKASVER